MKEALLVLCLLSPVFHVLYAQEGDKAKTESFGILDEVNINKEILPFSRYFSEYRINNNFVFRAENIETNFGGFNTNYRYKEVPLLFNYQFNTKFSTLFGTTTNILLRNGTVEDVSTSGTIGVKYDFSESFLMEARMNYNFNNHSPFKQNLPSTNSLFNLGGKYKF